MTTLSEPRLLPWWLIIFVLLYAMFAVGVAMARDLGQFANVSPERRACFQNLVDRNGKGCCDVNDGYRIEDPDWRSDQEGGYSVRLDGQWHKVPPSADIVGLAKPCVGWSIVWRSPATKQIVCFLPGSGS